MSFHNAFLTSSIYHLFLNHLESVIIDHEMASCLQKKIRVPSNQLHLDSQMDRQQTHEKKYVRTISPHRLAKKIPLITTFYNSAYAQTFQWIPLDQNYCQFQNHSYQQ